jgi:hypothetical protein
MSMTHDYAAIPPLPAARPASARTRAGLVRIGLGTAFSALAKLLGIRRCGGCMRRELAMNSMATIALPAALGSALENANPCTMFTGRCTGFGRRQCVVAPVSMSPDAQTIEQCCGGWFQYPWIEVCDGRPPRTGCGFCLW